MCPSPICFLPPSIYYVAYVSNLRIGGKLFLEANLYFHKLFMKDSFHNKTIVKKETEVTHLQGGDYFTTG